MTCTCNPELTRSGYHRTECPEAGPSETGRTVSHDYLARAADMLERGQKRSAELLVRAAEAEVNMPASPSQPWCGCMVCQDVLVAVRLQRHVG